MVVDFEAWRGERHLELSSSDSWLGLAGLYWLDKGISRVGSGEDCAVRLGSGPLYLGDLDWSGEGLRWRPLQGGEQVLDSDRDGRPTVVEFENWAFFAVEREGRIAIRVRDRQWAQHRPFAGIDCFAYDPAWAVDAEWQPLLPPRSMLVPNVTGDLTEVEVAFRALFTVGDTCVELLPMSVGEDEVFFVFRDRTSGRDTYGAGRFLKAGPPVDGKMRLDFNFAYNPPCAFTPFATCPLPPPENWLGFAVTAGEKKYSGEH